MCSRLPAFQVFCRRRRLYRRRVESYKRVVSHQETAGAPALGKEPWIRTAMPRGACPQIRQRPVRKQWQDEAVLVNGVVEAELVFLRVSWRSSRRRVGIGMPRRGIRWHAARRTTCCPRRVPRLWAHMRPPRRLAPRCGPSGLSARCRILSPQGRGCGFECHELQYECISPASRPLLLACSLYPTHRIPRLNACVAFIVVAEKPRK